MTPDARHHYRSRMERVLDHIDAHLDEALDVELLSGVAAFSRFHFHRQFTALCGLPVQRYVQLARMKRASWRLAFRPDARVTDIAFDAGYAAPESFTRAFRQAFGQPPSAFRDAPDWAPWQAAMAPLTHARSLTMQSNFALDDVTLIHFPETRIAVMEHRGDPALIGDTLRRFIDWRRRTGLAPSRSATFNLFHTDPEQGAAEDHRLGLGATVNAGFVSDQADVTVETIPAGRCAVLRVTGPDAALRPAADWLYREWLPVSGEELRDFPFFGQRIRFFPDVPEQEAVIDLFLPLKD
ncbi:AraC family transcriptional regulator [Sphingomonas hengshuiensis]|uniref:AraC family transcriptional regulator n=1 Tax=Sphingomonas hengshuiensis TaxID=1609977 RepID=A0A7U4JA29_9SPHN|nr:AraC family transcriptional regulator [Sphingomonas hengshuiensis]AJP73008.1 AraC family transcriptional regulator [Sphingomonas hengshuiensis]